MNFNSTGNNFGAGQIAFKSHQEENFVVLNAKFTYNPESPEYQAADVLEIYVPDLSIDRSAISGVFLGSAMSVTVTDIPGITAAAPCSRAG